MSPVPVWRTWTALGLVYVVWGSTYLAIRYLVETLPPLLSASARFLTAAALLSAYVLVRRRPVRVPSARQAAAAAGIGLLLLLGGNGGVTLAESAHLPSGLAALLVAGVPLWVVVLRALARDRPSPTTVAGVALGLVGLAVLLLPGARPQGVATWAVLLVLLSSVLWAVGSYLASRLDLPADPLQTTVLQMVGGGAGLAVAGLVRGESLDVDRVSGVSVVAWAYLVVFGSLVAFTAYSWLLGTAPVSWVATYAYVNPVVAVLLGVVVAGEAVTVTTLVGGAVTVLAVAVVVAEEGRRRRAQPLEVPADAPVAQRDG
ncbi:MAG: EamA family transporter [Actinomycetota bacterium]|nr:EamA family transporter [Actinomycetota bacterium]